MSRELLPELKNIEILPVVGLVYLILRDGENRGRIRHNTMTPKDTVEQLMFPGEYSPTREEWAYIDSQDGRYAIAGLTTIAGFMGSMIGLAYLL